MAALRLVLEAPAVLESAQRFRRLDPPHLLAASAGQWAQEGLRTLQRATPVRTGQMQRAWQSTAGPQGAQIANETPYARFVLDPTAAHRIAGSPVLAFIAGGKTVVTRSVQHPGTRGNAELARAIEQVVARGQDVGAAVAEEVAQEVIRGG